MLDIRKGIQQMKEEIVSGPDKTEAEFLKIINK